MKGLNSSQLPLTKELAGKETGSEQEVIREMETQEERANREARLCVTHRFEGLIESAEWLMGNERAA